MGSGKSSVGRELPALLALPGGPFDFIDLDEYIVGSEGMSVNEIFALKGEDGFRSIERKCLETLLERYEDRNLVLALGGGTAVYNSELVRSHTRCIYLSASVDTLVKRLACDTSRPLLAVPSSDAAGSSELSHTNITAGVHRNSLTESRKEALRSRIEKLFTSREPIYLQTAHHTIPTDGLTVAAVAALIAGLF